MRSCTLELGGGSWLVGRVTGQEFAKQDHYPQAFEARLPGETWVAQQGVATYSIILDPGGKIAWGRGDIDGDPIVVVLTKDVPDSHLAGLRADGVSYIFAGTSDIDLHLAMDILQHDFGIARILLEGGGVVNGSFLRAGLIDDLSLLLVPAIDGSAGAPSVFDSSQDDTVTPPVESLSLISSTVLEESKLWLRYRVQAR
jgi:riboflavin biosynthesis pyrimidine reductase